MAHVSSAAASKRGGLLARAAACLAAALFFAPPLTYSWHAVVVASSVVGACSLSAEYEEEWRSLRLRARHPEYKQCAIDRESMLSFLSSVLAKTDPPAAAGGYETIDLGRLIDYPWISHYLASAAARDAGWSAKLGKPLSGDINAYVDALLLRSEFTRQIDPTFAERGYKLVAVTVEKVLVGPMPELPGRVPYDAMVWLRIEKR